MNGAESLMLTLAASGVDTCFANPGTSEMHAVAALDRHDSVRPILGLFEGAVTGMADGYARMTGRPAATLLHLATGLSYGIANLHNARRAGSPIVNIVGEHALYHLQWDTPLVADIESLARPVSCWVRRSQSARHVAGDAAQAVAAARSGAGGVATLILPADTAWNEADGPAPAIAPARRATPAEAAIDRALQLLRSGRRTVILARGAVLLDEGLTLLGRIAAATGAEIMCDFMAGRVARGAGRPPIERVPYRAEIAVQRFQDVANLILVGSQPPVAAFAYPNYPSWVLPEGITIHYLAHEHEDTLAALAAVAEQVGPDRGRTAELDLPGAPGGSLDATAIGALLARLMPEGAIVSDEAASSGGPLAVATRTARPHDWLSNTGGAIGQGIPVATGAAVGAPDRKVISLQADGSAMYTLQALWTQAREKLDVVTIVFANRSYGILKHELERVGAPSAGPRALTMLDIDRPDLGWVKLAEGLGVDASRAETIAQLDAQLSSAIQGSGPRLIEAVI